MQPSLQLQAFLDILKKASDQRGLAAGAVFLTYKGKIHDSLVSKPLYQRQALVILLGALRHATGIS